MSEAHEPGSYLKATLEGQPADLARLLADDSAARAATRLRDCSRILLAGTGTSFHGALAGQFILRSAGFEAWALPAFELANYPMVGEPLQRHDIDDKVQAPRVSRKLGVDADSFRRDEPRYAAAQSKFTL